MEKWREDLYESNYLVHYGISGQKKGYTHGRRNGKDVAMTEYEDGSQPSAASRIFNVNKSFATNSGNGIRPARANGARLVSPQRKAIANPMNEKEFKTRIPNIQRKTIGKQFDTRDANDTYEPKKDNNKEEYFWEKDNTPRDRYGILKFTRVENPTNGKPVGKAFFDNSNRKSKTGLNSSVLNDMRGQRVGDDLIELGHYTENPKKKKRMGIQ